MYSIIKNVIEQGGFELSSLLKKIDTLWVQGSINDSQRDELIASTRDSADKQASVDVMVKLEDLDRRVKALEKGDTAEEYPDFVVGKWYYAGDTCTFEGEKYTCIAPSGVACVWSPADYPAYWEIAQ